MQNIEGKKNKNGEKTKFLSEKFWYVKKKAVILQSISRVSARECIRKLGKPRVT